MQITLTAAKRTILGKSVSKLRKSEKLPAVVYGHGLETLPLEVDEKEFRKAFKSAGENTIVSLHLDGRQIPVIIHDVQMHYLKDHPIHVDFYAVRMDEKLKADIPVRFVGESAAVKAMGGVLVKNLSEIEVECLPSDLPQYFEVDISFLNTFEDSIRVSDLKVPEGVKVLAPAEELIANVAAPRTEEELKALETEVKEDVASVEGVIKPETEVKGEAEAEEAEKKQE
ncbi:MAG: 50S ribosomal protein L25 [Candidatus Doudnabacteria bacterium]|nr:50S ribosomal protein L25 [Candidatus Doudnabacteria bacterium]